MTKPPKRGKAKSTACASNKNKTFHRKAFCATHRLLSHLFNLYENLDFAPPNPQPPTNKLFVNSSLTKVAIHKSAENTTPNVLHLAPRPGARINKVVLKNDKQKDV